MVKMIIRVGFIIPLIMVLALVTPVPIGISVIAHPAAPVLENDWTVNDTGGVAATSITLTKPAGVATGDLLLLIVGNDESNVGDWNDVTGWTKFVNANGATSDAALGCYWRIATASENATVDVTCTLNELYGWYIRVSGVNTTTPIHVIGTAGYVATSPYTITEVTTSVDDCLVFYATAFDGGDASSFTESGTGWAEVDEQYSGTAGTDACGSWGTKTMSGQGATGDVSITLGVTDGTSSIQFAVAPPAGAVVPPTVTTQAATDVEATTATGNGNITATGGANCDARGFDWDIDSGAPYANSATDNGTFGTGAFTKSLTGLPTGTTIYYRAKAHNHQGWGYGGELTFLTKPAAPTNVVATDGDHTDKVVITWTKSTGATDYQVYRDATPLGWAGDVATYDDTGADAPSITPGDTVASDGISTSNVSLSLSGAGTNDGTTHTYKVRAKNATGESADSATDTGYRSPGALTYQWQRSLADSDADYSNIVGATSSTYEDTAAPAPTITPGAASASDGAYAAYVELTLTGQSANVGDGRYYKCVLNAAGCAEQKSSANRGYRGVGSLTYQWERSADDSDADYSDIPGATTATYNDTGAPADGSGRYYKCRENADGASEQTSTNDRGYRDTVSAPTVVTDNATSITSSGATLNGNITATGGENCDERGFEWGLSSGNYSANWTEVGSFGTGSFSHGISSLSENTTYYYRALAHNSVDWGYGGEKEFTTSIGGAAPPDVPSDFKIRRLNATEINISWAPVVGATNYLLLVSTVTYPSSPTGGDTVAYSGNLTSINLINYNLEAARHYFSLWSQSNPYSSGYATAAIIDTTITDELNNIYMIFQSMVMLLPLVIFSVLAFWRLHPVLFMFAGGTAMITGLYMPDIMAGGATNNLSITACLGMIGYSFICFGFAFRMMFTRRGGND